MSRWVTLAQLRERTLRRVDLYGSGAISDADLNSMLQESATELYDLIISTYGEDYYVKTADLATDADSDSVSLPSDFYKLLAVDIYPNATSDEAGITVSGTPWEANQFQWDDRLKFVESPGWSKEKGVFYRLKSSGEDGAIWFIPTPTQTHGIRIHYIPRCPTMSGTYPIVDFDGINGWEEYIVLDTAIKLAERDETIAIDPLMASLSKVTNRIRAMAPNRDTREPAYVRRRANSRDVWPWNRGRP